MTAFDGLALARGWLSVAVASGGADKHLPPTLQRTISIEEYAEGLRLTATDTTLLLTTWVPNLTVGELHPEPEPDEIPSNHVIAYDPHGRGKGFLGHVLALALARADDDNIAKAIEVDVQLAVDGDEDDEPGPATFDGDGFDDTYLQLELEGHERLRLVLLDGGFPTWRKLALDFKGRRTDQVALAPEMAGRLAKLGKIQPGATLGFQWAGADKAARLTLVKADPAVAGFVMPCRWDLDANTPFIVPDDLSDLEADDA